MLSETMTSQPLVPNSSLSVQTVKIIIDNTISRFFDDLKRINETIHSNPELAYHETIAHSTLTTFLQSQNFNVMPAAYGLQTAFEARSHQRKPGRTVNFNAEYDALPGIGHGCGHNLIATASLVAFLALSTMIEICGVPGQVQLLGTPAEESGGGKIDLLKAGAYDGIDVSIMGHPFSQLSHGPNPLHTGSAGQKSLAHLGLTCSFKGKNAHAAGNPWDGLNSLDAVVCAYNSISMLRQQIRPEERIHGCILEAPKVTNVIPDRAIVEYSVRSPTLAGARALGERLRKCFAAAGMATGCGVEIEEAQAYADLRINRTLCEVYTTSMLEYGEQVCTIRDDLMSGNVSYAVPALHVLFGIAKGGHPHDAHFARCAVTDDAFDCAVRAGKAMALTGWQVLTNEKVFESCRRDFEEDTKWR